MAESIHRNGAEYRVWGSIVDAYLTESMTRAEMLAYLCENDHTAEEAEERIARADAKGTSLIPANYVRDATKWDTERCPECEHFHHAYDDDAGACAYCGDAEADNDGHKPPCVRSEQ